jgi:hypothetical protein
MAPEGRGKESAFSPSPGLPYSYGKDSSLAFAASKRPTALPADTLSQADILIIHRLTLVANVKAVGNLASTYARDLSAILKGVRDPGQAIIVDDTAERAVVGRVISQ